jgi:hypothetical protein
MSNSCSGVVVLVTRGRFAATTADQSTFFSRKNPYCSAQVCAKTSKFESGVLGVGLSHAAGLRSMRWTIMSDAANATCTRASVAEVPGSMTNVTGASDIVNAARAPAGGAVIRAVKAGRHETFVTSKLVTVSGRTSMTRP